MNRETDIRYLKGIGEKRAQAFYSLGIDNVGALLRFYPRAYKDWSDTKGIADCSDGEKVCIRARIATEIEQRDIRPKMTIYKFIIEDSARARMSVTLFNTRYLAERLHKGSEYLFYGKFGAGAFLPELPSPEIAEVTSAGIHPVYRSSKAISSKQIERLVKGALFCDLGDDPIPQSIREEYGLCGLRFAIENIHFPRSADALAAAQKRLVFEELFLLQVSLFLLRKKHRALTAAILKRDFTDLFLSHLPFELTAAQKRVISECTADMKSGKMMNRLIQGDVGSGKTAVAAALCYNAAKNGLQSAVMVPTEVLAEQHFKTISSFLSGSTVKCVCLTGSTKKKEKRLAAEMLSSGEAAIAIGTHALLTDNIVFKNLGLVICDEQHRFGVEQRAKLSAKGENPHLCVMSATPIPRTLGLILYGDLDISIIDEYPRGRQKIDCYTVDSSYRPRVYNYIKRFLDAGRQGYIVCPLVEESESGELKSAEEYYKDISENEFKDYSVGILHGKMSAKSKERQMRAFAAGETQLLICTTVIEVGIDVPNAAIMVIENAERFGLSQLHQLRGRIGRGKYQSSCVLISDASAEQSRERLAVLRDNSDGFRIADEDLRLRGPGDFLGSRQHGLPEFKIADLSSDMETMKNAGKAARALLKYDPTLSLPENSGLRSQVAELYRKMKSGG